MQAIDVVARGLGLVLTAITPVALVLIRRRFAEHSEESKAHESIVDMLLLLAILAAAVFFGYLLTVALQMVLWFICGLILSISVLVVASAYAYRIVMETKTPMPPPAVISPDTPTPAATSAPRQESDS